VSLEYGDPKAGTLFGKIKKATTDIEYIHVVADDERFSNIDKVIIYGEHLLLYDVKDRIPLEFSGVEVEFVKSSMGHIAKIET
jgi:hypothetical protein